MKIETSLKELRQFAFTMAAMIVVLFAFLLPWLYQLSFSYIPYIIATIFIILALLKPQWLNPVHKLWIKFSSLLGFINSKILLFIIYYFLIVPMGLVAKVFGFDPMRKKHTTETTFYIHHHTDKNNKNHNNMENPF